MKILSPTDNANSNQINQNLKSLVSYMYIIRINEPIKYITFIMIKI